MLEQEKKTQQKEKNNGICSNKVISTYDRSYKSVDVVLTFMCRQLVAQTWQIGCTVNHKLKKNITCELESTWHRDFLTVFLFELPSASENSKQKSIQPEIGCIVWKVQHMKISMLFKITYFLYAHSRSVTLHITTGKFYGKVLPIQVTSNEQPIGNKKNYLRITQKQTNDELKNIPKLKYRGTSALKW